MAYAINKCTFIGRVGKVEDIRAVGDSVKLQFSIAVNEKFGDKEYVEWFDCELWGKFAEAMKAHINVGDQVYVDGAFRSREVEKDGVKRRYYGIRVNDIVVFPKGERRSDADDSRRPATKNGEDPYEFPSKGSKGRFG